jgi:hypothetical protein
MSRAVVIVRWGTSTEGKPMMRFDGVSLYGEKMQGEWGEYIPESGEKVPRYSTIKQILVSWQRKQE